MSRVSLEPAPWACGAAGPHALAALLLAGVLGVGTILPELGSGGPAVLPFRDPAVRPQPGPPAARPPDTVRVLTGPGPKPAPSGRLDLNRADARALAALPGIGPALAERIVADRAARGPFASPDDLRRVPGIGAGRLERIRPLIEAVSRP